MNKIFKNTLLSLIFVYLLSFSNYVSIFAAHNHNDDCYEKIEHKHNDDCYEKIEHSCDGIQYVKSTADYEKCQYCNVDLFEIRHYVYVCDKNENHTGHSWNKTSIVSSSWENYVEEQPDGSFTSRSDEFIHKCPNPAGVVKTQYMNLVGMPGPSPCTYIDTTMMLTCFKQYENGNLICNTKIKDVVPKNKYQTTKNPNFTLVVTYMDEHKEEVQPDRHDFNSSTTYAKDTEVCAYYSKGSDAFRCVFYITTPTPIPTQTSIPTPTKKPTLIITPTTTVKPTKTPTPSPTITVTPTITKKPTLTTTTTPTTKPSQTPTLSLTPTPTLEINKETNLINTPTIETTITPTITPILSGFDPNTYDGGNGNNGNGTSSNFDTNVDIGMEKDMPIEQDSLDMNNFDENYIQNENDLEKEKNGSNLFLFIGIVAGIVAIVVVALVVITKSNSSTEYVKKNDDDIYYDIYL